MHVQAPEILSGPPTLFLHMQAPEILACPDKTLPQQNKEMDELAYSTKVD